MLSVRQRKMIIGTLLGDGHLETMNGGRTYRLKIEHSIAQADYVYWFYDQFREWVNSQPYIKEKHGKKYVGFSTYSHGVFRYYAHQFYRNKRKVVPSKIMRMLDPVSIAIWFMDDGSRKSLKHNTYVLQTYGFSRNDQERLMSALQGRFAVETSLHSQKQEYWRIYIKGGESAKRFDEIIRPLVELFPSMNHKLSNITPKE